MWTPVNKKSSILVVVALLFSVASPFVSSFSVDNKSNPSQDRRSILAGGTAALLTTLLPSPVQQIDPAHAAALGAGTPVGREIDTFNSLIYNFKNIDLGGGLDASTLNEPSIPFVEFGEKMKNGEVAFVEFLAPRYA